MSPVIGQQTFSVVVTDLLTKCMEEILS